MSRDFRVLECTTNNLDDTNLKYNFLGYSSIISKDNECFTSIQSVDTKRFAESGDGYDDFRTFDSVVFEKNQLLDIIDKYSCNLQEQLKELIEQSEFNYIVLQLF